MLTFPNAKINLGLNITEKRPDGYHNLETIFYPVPIEDALEINILNEGNRKFRLHQAGLEIEGEAESNLVVKAYKLLDDQFNLPPVDIHLFKHIPSGAGLGGGSADAAFMLKLLNNKFELGLPDDTLEEYAAKLGADCAFFIRNRPEYYKIYTSADGSDLRGMAEIIIAKHRNGAVGDVRLRFIGQYTRFQNPEDDMVIPPPTEGGGATFGSRMNAPIGSTATPPLYRFVYMPPRHPGISSVHPYSEPVYPFLQKRRQTASSMENLFRNKPTVRLFVLRRCLYFRATLCLAVLS